MHARAERTRPHLPATPAPPKRPPTCCNKPWQSMSASAPPGRARQASPSRLHALAEELQCRRCGRAVVVSAAQYETFERMHYVCFHYELEHDPAAAAATKEAVSIKSMICQPGVPPATIARVSGGRRNSGRRIAATARRERPELSQQARLPRPRCRSGFGLTVGGTAPVSLRSHQAPWGRRRARGRADRGSRHMSGW